jgi:methionyl-tRNA formyltransferase
MHIALMCATKRGRMVLEKLIELAPQAEITVFSFKEDPWEPLYFDEIKEITVAHGGKFFEAKNVGRMSLKGFWESTSIDIAFAISWRYMIPSEIYRLPAIGTFVFHDSLLPEYRGFSPTVWSIINGEDHTGVTLFKISEEVDSGDILDQEKVPIGPDETIGEIIDRVTQTYLSILEKNLDPLLKGSFHLREQDESKATYTCKRLPEDNKIDWNASTAVIYNLIRATGQPYPGAFTSLEGQILNIWSAEKYEIPRFTGIIPGRVIRVLPGTGSVVLTCDGALLIKQVQIKNSEIECAADVINSLRQTLGC